MIYDFKGKISVADQKKFQSLNGRWLSASERTGSRRIGGGRLCN